MKLPLFLVFASLLVFGAAALSSYAAEYPSPNKQIRQGVLPQDIECNADLVLVIKSSGGPACIKEDTAFRLLQSGWAEKIVPKKESPPVDSASGPDTWTAQEHSFEGSGTLHLDSSAHPISPSIGLAVGGAQDINNFRSNIENGFLPLHTDITYEGLFYDYYFETGSAAECEKLFCPSYGYAVSRDPFSENDEYYLSVGLNSGLREEDFERKRLNLVVVLDVSGSMGSKFNQYYYGSSGNPIPREDSSENDTKSKMQLANESVVGLLDHLDSGDNLGVVLFDGAAHAAKPLESIGDADMERLAQNIMDIRPSGGTNMESGMRLGTSLYDGMLDANFDEYENRIIFLTDAMPNLGNISDEGLLGMISENSKNGIYTTFIGIGVDLNTELVEKITKVRGANYYSVHSASEFENRMVDEFEFMVTPLVFNLLLNLDAEGYKISKVYGSPEADESTGQLMKVNTLFPSKTKDGQTKGGMVLLKIERISEDADSGSLVLKTSYEDRSGDLDGNQVTVNLGSQEPDYYENAGIRKGILLSRYAELMKTWAFEERMGLGGDYDGVRAPATYYKNGIHIPDHVESYGLGQWERQSVPLQVSNQYEQLISEFSEYFADEMKAIGDDTLQQELDILYKLDNF